MRLTTESRALIRTHQTLSRLLVSRPQHVSSVSSEVIRLPRDTSSIPISTHKAPSSALIKPSHRNYQTYSKHIKLPHEHASFIRPTAHAFRPHLIRCQLGSDCFILFLQLEVSLLHSAHERLGSLFRFLQILRALLRRLLEGGEVCSGEEGRD